jgi:nucleoside-diphosphate-sugar epimerase
MILVTGATGLVGGNLIWYLLQDNERITATRRDSTNIASLYRILSFYTSTPDIYLARIIWKTADVLNEQSICDAMSGISIVYHCAAIVSLGKDAGIMSDTNVIGTRNIVNAALKVNVKKLCFVSSIAACGRSVNGEKIDENTTWIDSPMRSAYSRSKYYSEQEVWKGIKQGLNAVIVNPGVILGISGNDNGSAQLFNQVRKGLMFYINGGTAYIDIKDVVEIMIGLTNSDISAEKYVLVGENCSNHEVLSWIADGFGKRRPFIHISRWTLLCIGTLSEWLAKLLHFKPLIDKSTARSATHREYYSNSKIQKVLNHKFTPIKESIKKVCDFQLNN